MDNIIHRYVVTHDHGYAPCVDNDLLSLCICKPAVRRVAKVGDWLIGFTSKDISESLSVNIHSVAYIAEVTKKISMQEYFLDKDYRKDKIYEVVYGQIIHLGGKNHNTEDLQKKDKDGIYYLISDRFWYFGKKPITLPPELENLNMSDHLKKG